LTLRGKTDDQVGGHDQEVPLPPARVPLALAGEGDADQGLGEQHEAGDHRGRQQVWPQAEDRPVAGGAGCVDDRADDREDGEQASPRGLAVRPVERGQIQDGPDEPPAHRHQHGDAQEPAVADHERSEPGPHVDERGRRRERRADEQAHRDRDLEARVVPGEEHAACPERVKPHEAAGRHEGEREEKHPRVAAAVCRLAGREAEHERDRPHQPEEHEVDAVVLEVRVELRAQQQRSEPDQRQRDCEELGDRSCADPLPRRAHRMAVRIFVG
jgi:hypothetical protein